MWNIVDIQNYIVNECDYCFWKLRRYINCYCKSDTCNLSYSVSIEYIENCLY